MKLNQRGRIYNGLASVEPQQEEFEQFLNFLQAENKTKPRVKSTSVNKNNIEPPDLMELYPKDLLEKEFAEVEIDPVLKSSATKPHLIKASMNFFDNETESFYNWN